MPSRSSTSGTNQSSTVRRSSPGASRYLDRQSRHIEWPSAGWTPRNSSAEESRGCSRRMDHLKFRSEGITDELWYRPLHSTLLTWSQMYRHPSQSRRTCWMLRLRQLLRLILQLYECMWRKRNDGHLLSGIPYVFSHQGDRGERGRGAAKCKIISYPLFC